MATDPGDRETGLWFCPFRNEPNRAARVQKTGVREREKHSKNLTSTMKISIVWGKGLKEHNPEVWCFITCQKES